MTSRRQNVKRIDFKVISREEKGTVSTFDVKDVIHTLLDIDVKLRASEGDDKTKNAGERNSLDKFLDSTENDLGQIFHRKSANSYDGTRAIFNIDESLQ